MLEKRHLLTMPASWAIPREVWDVKHSSIDIFRCKILVSHTQVSKTVKNMYTQVAFKPKYLPDVVPQNPNSEQLFDINVSLEQSPMEKGNTMCSRDKFYLLGLNIRHILRWHRNCSHSQHRSMLGHSHRTHQLLTDKSA